MLVNHFLMRLENELLAASQTTVILFSIVNVTIFLTKLDKQEGHLHSITASKVRNLDLIMEPFNNFLNRQHYMFRTILLYFTKFHVLSIEKIILI
jgi:hypothetical protein